MSFDFSPKKGFHLAIPVPLEPYFTTGGGECSAAELNYQRHGSCSCWELLGLVSALRYQYSEVSDRLCQYHQEYYQHRTSDRLQHLCSCNNPERYDLFCWGCGYCHLCGADLCTTSTTRFHRCSCLPCLNRCCGLFGTQASYLQQAKNRHLLRHRFQARSRCQHNSATTPQPQPGRTQPPPLRSLPREDPITFFRRRRDRLNRSREAYAAALASPTTSQAPTASPQQPEDAEAPTAPAPPGERDQAEGGEEDEW